MPIGPLAFGVSHMLDVELEVIRMCAITNAGVYEDV